MVLQQDGAASPLAIGDSQTHPAPCAKQQNEAHLLTSVPTPGMSDPRQHEQYVT